ncbi:MAG: hypothetical protein COT84_07415 [Chlamydiae bacterium CG10_big_fil_rev_8_21_14_0_10_35_9]|nr:MAG: hypothetical protein COT84_07415 [Chlamydiae bacterium CG10_big_fil_rev_8_21_14_0_10_35_9]
MSSIISWIYGEKKTEVPNAGGMVSSHPKSELCVTTVAAAALAGAAAGPTVGLVAGGAAAKVYSSLISTQASVVQMKADKATAESAEKKASSAVTRDTIVATSAVAATVAYVVKNFGGNN